MSQNGNGNPSPQYLPTAMDYSRKNEIEHILDCPGMYLGDTAPEEREEWLLDVNKFEHIKQNITMNSVMERTFMEIISNAGDNAHRSIEAGIDPGSIVVEMTNRTIRVVNQGLWIPIEMHPVEKLYAPELIFGHLRSGSNYKNDGKRKTIGQNGLGCKIVSIWSKLFVVICADPQRHLLYQQQWSDNFSKKTEPKITPYDGKTGLTVIEYTLDFDRLKCKGYDDSTFKYFSHITANVGYSCRVPTYFNNTFLKTGDIKSYARSFFGDKVDGAMVYVKYADGKSNAKNNSKLEDKETSVEVLMVDAPDNGITISFVNGLITPDHGVHVTEVVKQITDGVCKAMGKKVTPKEVQQHISIMMNCRLVEPKFDSQLKKKLIRPKPLFKIPETHFKIIDSWDLTKRLEASLEAKMFRQLKKSDGKKTRHIDLPNVTEANLAGTKESEQCSAFLTEGRSADGYATNAIAYMKGSQLFGSFPLRGKFLNTMDISMTTALENNEVVRLKKYLGLEEGVDYTKDENYRKLRYGRVIIATDADPDGVHIAGLLINFFWTRYRTLLQRGYVFLLQTPIVILYKGKQRIKFYSQRKYEEWMAKTSESERKAWKPKYLKGLGSSNPQETKEEFSDDNDNGGPRFIYCLYDDKTDERVQMAFSAKQTAARKIWMRDLKHLDIDDMKMMSISYFIDHVLVQHANYNMCRSIPHELDGIKIAQRKCLYGAMKKCKKSEEQYKLGRLANAVCDSTGYHHGEMGMCKVMLKMGQSFISSNNLPYFKEDGQFGTRQKGGKDASDPRYPYTNLEWWINLVYRKEDIPLLEIIHSDGKKVEPKFLLPILPMMLVNGCNGIGTGYSTFIPSYNPADLIFWLQRKLDNKSTPDLLPWYRGYTGSIAIRTKKSNKGQHLVSSGKYHIEGDTVVVTEIPVYKWYNDQEEHYNNLRIEGKIKDYTQYAEERNGLMHKTYRIEGMRDISMRTLKLTKHFSLTNMTLLDEKYQPVKFNSVNEILENFFKKRLEYYEKRKKYSLDACKEMLDALTEEIRFVRDVIDEKLIITGKNKKNKDIEEDMKKLGHSMALLKKIHIHRITPDGLQELQNKHQQTQAEFERLSAISPRQTWKQELDEFLSAYCRKYRETARTA